MTDLKEYKVLFTTEEDVDPVLQWWDVLNKGGCTAFKPELYPQIELADLVIFTHFNTTYIIKQRF